MKKEALIAMLSELPDGTDVRITVIETDKISPPLQLRWHDRLFLAIVTVGVSVFLITVVLTAIFAGLVFAKRVWLWVGF